MLLATGKRLSAGVTRRRLVRKAEPTSVGEHFRTSLLRSYGKLQMFLEVAFHLLLFHRTGPVVIDQTALAFGGGG